MNRLIILIVVLCWISTAEAGTNLLRGCRNCNLRTIEATEAVSVTATAKVATAPVRVARAKVIQRPQRVCSGRVCKAARRVRGTRAIAVTRRAWFFPRRAIIRSRVRS